MSGVKAFYSRVSFVTCVAFGTGLSGCAAKQKVAEWVCASGPQPSSLPAAAHEESSHHSVAADEGEHSAGEGEPQADASPFEPELLQRLRTRRLDLEKREEALKRAEAALHEREQARAKAMPASAPSRPVDERPLLVPTVVDGMDPKAAARMLEAMDETDAAGVLAALATEKAGVILASIDAKKAAQISTLLLRRRERGAHATR